MGILPSSCCCCPLSLHAPLRRGVVGFNCRRGVSRAVLPSFQASGTRCLCRMKGLMIAIIFVSLRTRIEEIASVWAGRGFACCWVARGSSCLKKNLWPSSPTEERVSSAAVRGRLQHGARCHPPPSICSIIITTTLLLQKQISIHGFPMRIDRSLGRAARRTQSLLLLTLPSDGCLLCGAKRGWPELTDDDADTALRMMVSTQHATPFTSSCDFELSPRRSFPPFGACWRVVVAYRSCTVRTKR